MSKKESKVQSENKLKKENKGSRSKSGEHTEKIAELESALEESKDKYLRLYAEFDNYKKRTVKERLELLSTAAKETIVSMLPVLDDFERAKKSAELSDSGEVFTEGVSLVFTKFNSVLKSKGLRVMETEAADFDPEFHEAITEIPAPTEELKGKILDTIEKGYLLNDKIIRYAKVVVGK